MKPSYFANSHDVNVGSITSITAQSYFNHASANDTSGGTYIAAENYTHNAAPPATPLGRLQENSAVEAVHNSDERCDAPKVFRETREAVQQEIFGWISDGELDVEPKKILWLSGPAGAGKTAIAGTIAEHCEGKGLLAGSFFFSSYSGSEKRRTKRCLIATLVYSLLLHPGMQALYWDILSAVERDPAIFKKGLKDQCRALLLNPLRAGLNRLNPSSLPKVFILDGIDEVEAEKSRRRGPHEARSADEARSANEADQEDILSALLLVAQDPSFPFRIIVVSRPERVISDFFATKARHVSREIFLDDKYNPDFDIALFLRAKFAEIRRRYRISAAWPSEYQIRQLVANASGQFIYADTITRFLASGKRRNVQAILCGILDEASQDSSFNPLAPLDALYSQIVLESGPEAQLALRWLSVSQLKGDRDLEVLPAAFVRHLLQDFDGEEQYLFENLSSLVSIPPSGNRKSPYRIYHKSFIDFLSSAQRCGQQSKDSFDAGPAFFADRWLGLLKTGPLALDNIVGSERLDFVEAFLRVIGAEVLHEHLRQHHSYESIVATCDVGAWVREVDEAFMAEPDRASDVVSDAFHMIHFQCILHVDSTQCCKVCQHWRSSIIGECKLLGWTLPNIIARFCEWFWWMGGETEEDLEDVELDFQPPTNRFQPSVLPPSDIVEVQARQKVYLDEYNAQCETIDLIWGALPEDPGDVKFGSEINGFFIPNLRKLLRMVDPEVRLQVEGLDEWLRPSSEYDEEVDETDAMEADEVEGSDYDEDDSNYSEDEGTEQLHGSYHSGVEDVGVHTGGPYFEAVDDIQFRFRQHNRLPISGSSGETSSGIMALGSHSHMSSFHGPHPGPRSFPQSFPSPDPGYDAAMPWNYGSIQINWNAPLVAPSNVPFPSPTPNDQPFHHPFDVPMTGLSVPRTEPPRAGPDEEMSWVETTRFPFHHY